MRTHQIVLCLTAILFLASVGCAQQITWHSPATGIDVNGTIHIPERSKSTSAGMPLVIYMKNLAVPRLGTEADESLIQSYLDQFMDVLVLDYQKHPKSVAPFLNLDALSLRQDIAGKTPKIQIDYKIDPDRIFVIMEGNRLMRDVEFARDGDRVLAMDIIYPSKPAKAVPIVFEITCDNANRMGNFSINYCQDTLLETAQLRGFAAAMVDHPVRAPYKGIDDPMPQSFDRMKDAAKKLREIKDQIHNNGKIGAIGFSRGAPFAAMLAMQADVDAALVHGNRFQYTDLLPTDPMLARFEKAWGKLDENRDNWAKRGAFYYFTGQCKPMYLNTSDKESAEYQNGLAELDAVLTKHKIEHVYKVDPDGRGHKIATDPQRLTDIFDFFQTHLAAD